MKFTAVYLERLCETGGTQLDPHTSFLFEFARRFKDGDTVAIVGCGEKPRTALELEKVSQHYIEIYCFDPLLEDTTPYSRYIHPIPKTFQEFLEIKPNPDLGVVQDVVWQAAKQDARLIAVQGCGCNHHGNSKPLALTDLGGKPSKYLKDLTTYLGANGYIVEPFNHFAFIAEKVGGNARKS